MNLLTTYHWEAPDRGRRGRGRARERSAETPPILRTLPTGKAKGDIPRGPAPKARLMSTVNRANPPELSRIRGRIGHFRRGPTWGSRAARKC